MRPSWELGNKSWNVLGQHPLEGHYYYVILLLQYPITSNHCGSRSFPDVLGQPPQYGRGLCPCSIFPSNNGEHRDLSWYIIHQPRCRKFQHLAQMSPVNPLRPRKRILKNRRLNGFGSENEERDPQKVSKHAVFTESSTNFSGRSSRGAPSATSISAQEIAMFILIYPDCC